jgi:hypothetical protein
VHHFQLIMNAVNLALPIFDFWFQFLLFEQCRPLFGHYRPKFGHNRPLFWNYRPPVGHYNRCNTESRNGVLATRDAHQKTSR